MVRGVLAIIALAILASTAIAGYQAALETAGDDTTITNETWTPDPGNVTTLDDSTQTGAYYTDAVDVYNDTGTPVDPDTDYTWFPGNGTIKTTAGGALDGEPSATITYSYQQTTASQREFTGLLSQLPTFMGLILPLAMLLFFFNLLRGGL